MDGKNRDPLRGTEEEGEGRREDGGGGHGAQGPRQCRQGPSLDLALISSPPWPAGLLMDLKLHVGREAPREDFARSWS